MKSTFVLVCLVLAYALTNHIDRRVEAEEPKTVRVVNIERDPLDPPRCPKRNAAGLPLRYEVAMKADGGDWIHACEYETFTEKLTRSY